EDVAAGPAAETVEEALAAIDGERRRLLAMKRTETLVRLAGLLERRDLRDELDEVRGLADLGDELVVEVYESHYSSTATVAPSPPSLSAPGRHDFTAGCLRRCSRMA